MRKFNVNVNGQNYNVEVEEVFGDFSPKAPVVEAAPAPVAVAAPAPVAQVAAPAVKPAISAPVGGTKLLAPMPGTVLDIKVASGTKVTQGQAVLVLEAMKMENDIAANAAGTITVVATKGSTVNTGDVLAVIA
jgi:glutaconyl-CoA decarboxylase